MIDIYGSKSMSDMEDIPIRHKSILDQLRDRDISVFLSAGCHIFALYLNERFGYRLVAMWYPQNGSEGIEHVYAMNGEIGIDAAGPISREGFDTRFYRSNRREEITLLHLRAYFLRVCPQDSSREYGGTTIDQLLYEFARCHVEDNIGLFSPRSSSA